MGLLLCVMLLWLWLLLLLLLLLSGVGPLLASVDRQNFRKLLNKHIRTRCSWLFVCWPLKQDPSRHPADARP